jgi:hypothetical protein
MKNANKIKKNSKYAKQKPEDMKLLTKEDKNTRKNQKESKKWICTTLPSCHDSVIP